MPSPRVMVAAPHGRSGKTTLTVGIVAALAARGLSVQPFKKGPDYIDPSWLTAAGTRECRNLDLFMMDPDTVISAFRAGAAGAGISIIEGAMGLYDGLDLEGTGSSAALARLLRTPVLLVVDATRMTRSVAALVSGYQHFEPDVTIAGVILNNVARSRHEEILTGAIERYCGIPVLGAIPRRTELAIPDRHLGLVPRGECESLVPAIERAREVVEERVNLDLLLEIASSAPELEESDQSEESSQSSVISLQSGRESGFESRESDSSPTQDSGPRTQDSPSTHHSSLITHHSDITHHPEAQPLVRIGVLRDRAFSFYYPENLEALRCAGAEILFVDSLFDETLPDVDALYIGGGFPEVFMEQLEANVSLRRQIRSCAEEGMPVYAECGGLIYLSRRVRWGERQAEMVGVLPCEVEMTARPQGHGYAVVEVVGENPFFPVGRQFRGHEFHNTRVLGIDSEAGKYAYRVLKGSGARVRDGVRSDGLIVGNVLASYIHLHARAVPEWAGRMVEAARRHRGLLSIGGGERGERRGEEGC